MGHSQTWDLSLALIIVYVLLLPLIAINFLRHRHLGRSGWVYTALFCLLQIIGSGMELANNKYALIVLQVGLSPLILGLQGFSHEVNQAGRLNAPFVSNMIFTSGLHIVTVVGVGITAYGAYGETENPPKDNSMDYEKVGLVLLTIALAVAIALVFIVTCSYRRNRGAPALLLIACIISCPTLSVRLLDGLIFAFSSGDTHTKFSLPELGGNFALYVILEVLPGALITVYFGLAGLVVPADRAPQQNMPYKTEGNYPAPPPQQGYYPGYNGPAQGGRMV
ncbi:MAG: hypothetical protein M1828_004027 [Chrysothrix sp. TS-e1954]|nr:MAG: hypothetical protein M1828_004027 [Chrysothrix sp. TS-e1954]